MKLSLKDVLLIALLAVVLGVVYFGAGYISNAFVPFVGPIAHEVIYGIWFVAGPMALYILRKPGTAIVAELLAALIEVLLPAFILSAILTSIFSFAWSFYANGLSAFSFSYNILMLIVRTVSSIIFFLLTKNICDQLHRSGVLNAYGIHERK
ncbi:TPA: ECF transporter S component [Streptococcus agalactiae]